MKQNVHKSTVSYYVIAALWLLRALTGNLYSGAQIGQTVLLSVVIFLLGKLFFPDKLVNEEQPKEEKQPEPKKKPEKKTGDPKLDAVLKQGSEAISAIRARNDEIPDFKISAQLRQLELLTEKIFDFVRSHPEDVDKIREFLDYYLPTTVKLLDQYVELQNQQLRVGNIDDGMQKIEQMLEKIIVAFQRQLDSLFESRVVDLTAEIRVMENLMAAEGLTK